MPKSATAGAQIVSIPVPDIRELELTLIGDSPLVVHNWSDKAKQMIVDKQAKKAKQAREARNPEQEYNDALYIMNPGEKTAKYGFPTKGIKGAAVDACSFIEGVTKVEARGSFHIEGEFVQILGDKPKMRSDMVRIGMGTADIRYRPEFTNWHMTFKVRYNHNKITPEQIANLFNTAGFAIGIGEHRPQKDGDWGMFHVETETE